MPVWNLSYVANPIVWFLWTAWSASSSWLLSSSRTNDYGLSFKKLFWVRAIWTRSSEFSCTTCGRLYDLFLYLLARLFIAWLSNDFKICSPLPYSWEFVFIMFWKSYLLPDAFKDDYKLTLDELMLWEAMSWKFSRFWDIWLLCFSRFFRSCIEVLLKLRLSGPPSSFENKSL